MEKKLKFNFILKGIAVFAFVAFCLLAILAGVTLPFVSNASTTDNAVVITESDCAIASANSDNIYISINDVVIGTTYYGISIPNNDINNNAVIADNTSRLTLFNFHSLNDNFNFICVSSKFSFVENSTRSVIVMCLINGAEHRYATLLDGTFFASEFQYNNGFVFDSTNADALNLDILVRTVPYFSDSDVIDLQSQIATLTSEKNALQNQINSLTLMWCTALLVSPKTIITFSLRFVK